MKILFLAHLLPLPLDSGGKIKSFHTLKALASEHEVRLLAYTRGENEARLAPDLREVCAGVETVPLGRGKLRQACDLAAGLVSRKSFIVNRDFRAEMLRVYDAAVAEFRPDVVHIDHLQMARFVRFGGPYGTVLDQHNVESIIIKRVAETSRSMPMRLYAGIEWPKLQAYELDICRKCDMVLTVSDEDKATLLRLDSGIANIHSVPIGVDVDYFGKFERQTGSKNILSVGTMYWPPNIDSMLYFCRDILPLVAAKAPDCTLTIAGQRPARSIQALASDPRVKVTGYVDDMRKTAHECGVFIVPLRSGSGVRVKLLNAMAMGLPIVSTSVGAEGLDVVNGEHLLIADEPKDFARCVVELLGNPDLAEQLGRRAREMVCQKYSWEIVGRELLRLYGECMPNLQNFGAKR